MAAGMGSRFGGMKQLTPLTDEGEFIMDFTIYDAIVAGFDKFVIIIKPENEELFEEKIGKRLRDNGVSIRYAYQKQELPAGFEVPEGRVKPFGTGHAIMSIGEIDDNFGVVNADDCYGRDAFLKLASFLKDAKDDEKAHYCMVGYHVKNISERLPTKEEVKPKQFMETVVSSVNSQTLPSSKVLMMVPSSLRSIFLCSSTLTR